MRGHIFTLLLATWPCLQALFTVELEQDSYNGELYDNVTMGCRFSHIPSVSGISVIWRRIKPTLEDVYQLDMGKENPNVTSTQFQSRVRFLREELENFRAVIELSQLRLNDSGTYQCLVIHGEESDYKQITLTIQAPYKPINKTIRRLSEKEVELTCESQGFPLAHVTWSDGKLVEPNLTNRPETSHEKNSDGVFVVTSRLSVTHDTNNYTCSYTTDGTMSQTATFRIPDDIPENKWTTGYAAIAVIVVMCLGLVFVLLFLHRTKKGHTSVDTSTAECESPVQNLTVASTDHLLPKSDSSVDTLTFTSEYNLQDVLMQRYAESKKTTEMQIDFMLPHTLLLENQNVNIQSVFPRQTVTALLEGKERTGKTFIAQRLALSWANHSISDLFSIRELKLLILVDVKGVKGDFFQVVNSKIPVEAGLQTNNLKDSLLIPDGYKEGDRELDKSLVKFLRELITACPRKYGTVGETDRKVLRLLEFWMKFMTHEIHGYSKDSRN